MCCGVCGWEEVMAWTPWEGWSVDGFLCDPIFHVTITSPWGQKALIANKQLSKITRVSWTILRKQISVSVSRRSWKRQQRPMETESISVFWVHFYWTRSLLNYHSGKCLLALQYSTLLYFTSLNKHIKKVIFDYLADESTFKTRLQYYLAFSIYTNWFNLKWFDFLRCPFVDLLYFDTCGRENKTEMVMIWPVYKLKQHVW